MARCIASTRPSHVGVKRRLVLLDLDLAEAVHAAHVVNAVHHGDLAGLLRQAGADHASRA